MFALSSVANSEYYKLLMQNGQDERRDATVCSLEELERVTSEHTLKNTVNTHAHAQNTQKLNKTSIFSIHVPLNTHFEESWQDINHIAFFCDLDLYYVLIPVQGSITVTDSLTEANTLVYIHAHVCLFLPHAWAGA